MTGTALCVHDGNAVRNPQMVEIELSHHRCGFRTVSTIFACGQCAASSSQTQLTG